MVVNATHECTQLRGHSHPSHTPPFHLHLVRLQLSWFIFFSFVEDTSYTTVLDLEDGPVPDGRRAQCDSRRWSARRLYNRGKVRLSYTDEHACAFWMTSPMPPVVHLSVSPYSSPCPGPSMTSSSGETRLTGTARPFYQRALDSAIAHW